MRQLLGNEEALVRSETSPKSPLQIAGSSLAASLWPAGPSAEVSVEPSIRAFSICRPDLPMMSVATEASFMLAPSSVFCSLLTSAAALPHQGRPVAAQFPQFPLGSFGHEAAP